jgi:hypothetical protein
MKCFVKGLLGAFLFLICAVFIATQYSDYRARSGTLYWLALVQEVRIEIEQKALKQKSLVGVGNEVDKKAFQARNLNAFKASNIEVFDITESGIIILRGGIDGQVVILIPSLSEQDVIWRCVGGSAKAMPDKCKSLQQKRLTGFALLTHNLCSLGIDVLEMVKLKFQLE